MFCILFVFQEKLAWQEEKSQLESQIELITIAHTDDLENERVRLDFHYDFMALHSMWRIF
jgi:hypothetical protein